MQVILLERVAKLGQMGEVVDVKPGYARNYLLPQKKALSASKQNIADFEARKVQLEAQNLSSQLTGIIRQTLQEKWRHLAHSYQ